MQPMLLVRAEYAQYTHPVDEVLLQCLEQAEQPVPAMAAFLQDDLAVMVVEGLLDQIELMKRQHVSVLEQIERIGKCKAPVFEEPMVEPKRARALSQCPQELAWRAGRLPQGQDVWILRLCIKDRSWTFQQNPMAELSLEASNQIMSDAPAVQQEQRSEAPQAPVASSSKAGASSQGGARVVPELPAPHVQPAAVESHRLSVSVPALDVPGPLKHCRGQKPQANMSKMDVVSFPSNVPA
ncbi:hypothetical protein C0995_010783 [Termitomyces sp. Mi166|nr:hypothetical protein C0995_010783 [Termitomyces sp. Mi166\